MFNSFPIPKPDSGGSPNLQDWSAYTPVYDLIGGSVSVPASSWGTFVNVTGKGFLKWCNISTTLSLSANPAIRITVDGQAYTFDSSLTGNAYQGNEISQEIPFETSLKIEGFNRNTGAVLMLCDYLYLLRQSNPNAKKVTILEQTIRKMAYATGSDTSLIDLVNVTGSGYLLGARFENYYSSLTGYTHGDISIDGVQRMTDRQLLGIYNSADKKSEIFGPIRFNTSLRIKTKCTAGTFYVSRAWYTLD